MQNSFTEAGLRRYSTQEALKLALPMRKKLGISRLASVGEFVDIAGVSVVNAVRTTLKKGQISTTQGKGRSLCVATCSALMEAYERHCACWCDDLIIRHDAQHDDRLILRLLGFDPECDIEDWVPGYELQTGKKVLLPAVEVQFPYHGSDAQRVNIRAHTSGLACGGILEEAICFAILESFERNIISQFYQNCLSSICADIIDPESINHPPTKTLWLNLFDKGYESFALRIHGAIPTYYVALYDPTSMGPKFMIAGFASGFTETQALDAALMEAVQGLVVSLQASREDLSRHQKKYNDKSFFNHSRFYMLRELFHKHYETVSMPLAQDAPATLASATRLLTRKLAEKGNEHVYIIDLSLPEVPFHTVKAVIPGLFDWHVNPRRRQ
ncbi:MULTISPECIES: YcaO-like family protein [Photorhabdus]|uniref:YcaO domain-containing protein n=1 Tax=Photorhabdus kayaii TaxID=230088 RepID=A0ABX0B5M9_9GAMM|nr:MULTISPECIES: YcaO-like family protein [Photorhabdus]MCC8374511.1 YcaO-like family protein [Photorhabdus bodei]MCT8354345.1 YcaO-like family protein [Photorhabdus kayaii]MDB6368623.1 YcaO-like family protein [Photorhabdus bodei]NDL12463.1 hypothetical protein [Photorhabdus kayaii]NDL26039.1 hypothetical protein [Photorhabdus kayaii]